LKTVVICEKPNVAKKVEKIIRGPGIEVLSARGHLIELKFGDEDKDWSYPIIVEPEKLIAQPIAGSEDVLDKITDKCRGADMLVSATDLDREGSSIFMEIYRYLCDNIPGFKPELKRMELSSLTDKEIRKAWDNLDDFDWGRSYSGFTRNCQDMSWGINLTRALTIATGNLLGVRSGGRVQTPMLGMIVRRDREISNFEPVPYYQLELKLEAIIDGRQERFVMLYEGKLKTFEELRAVTDEIRVGDICRVSVEQKETVTRPPAPFNGTTLQIEGNRVLGFSAKEIADRQDGIAQALYEKGFCSYMGTDSEKYPADWEKSDKLDLKNLIESWTALSFPNDSPAEGSKEDSAHPCIRPVAIPNDADNLGDKEKKLYDLISRRCGAGFCEPAVDKIKTIRLKFGKHSFKTFGKTCTEKGWRTVYPFIVQNEREVPDLNDGDEVTVLGTSHVKKETRPPPKYSTTKLIARCEKYGLGTKNTRPGIVEKLADRGYIHIDGRGKKEVLNSTQDGCKLVDTLDKYADIMTGMKLTHMFNDAMDKIEMVNVRDDSNSVFVTENTRMLDRLADMLKCFKDNERTIGFEISGTDIGTPIICPECGNTMRLRASKDGKYRFFGCKSYPDCQMSFFMKDGEKPRFSYKCKCGMPLLGGEVTDRSGSTMGYVRCLNDDCLETPLRCSHCKSPAFVGRARKTGDLYVRCSNCNTFNQFDINMEDVTNGNTEQEE
jgi:DNA topoisomerase-1